MPKLKTNSSAKKRFKITGRGKIKATQAGKKHNMRKRSNNQIRDLRGTTILNDVETARALSYFPKGKKKKSNSAQAELTK